MLTTPGNLIIGTPKATGWSVGALQRRHRRQVAWAAAAAFLVTALAALLLQRLPYSLVSTIGLGVALPALLVWLWRAPVRGVYVLFAVAVVQESGFSAVPYPDDLGHYFPFFAPSAWPSSLCCW
jgi:hypothetical protein